MLERDNFGILTSISWNSNNWEDELTSEDILKSQYQYVKEKKFAHESLNFGYNKYPLEKNNKYIAYTPMFSKLPSKKNSENINIVFFISSDYKDKNKKKIIGCYGFPELGNFKRKAKHSYFSKYDSGNIKAHVDNIIYLKNYVEINNRISVNLNLLPKDKQISKQGFNYLSYENVHNILKLLYETNQHNHKLINLLKKINKLHKSYKAEIDVIKQTNSIIKELSADSLPDILELENRMKNKKPETKKRVSNYIERGKIASAVKKYTGYKCLICEKTNKNPYSFKTKKGVYYIETHHVEPVSTLKEGSLSTSNLITVCPNHHRQLHYGQSIVLENTNDYFLFNIDGKKIKINKIKIPNKIITL